MNTETIPKGYMQRADGTLVPTDKVKAIDLQRDKLVRELCAAADLQSRTLLAFKLTTAQAIDSFVEESAKAYDVAWGGKRGNLTLISFDGKFKVVRQVQDSIVFDERLQAAKAKIDACINRWAKGSNANIKALVNQAFAVDSSGAVSPSRVLSLRNIKIDDPDWLVAMQAITDSMQVARTKPYERFYKLNDAGAWDPITLNIAGV